MNNTTPKKRFHRGGVRKGRSVHVTPVTISIEIRRNILEALTADQVRYYGDTNELTFLESIYDLEKIPSLYGNPMGALADYYNNRINIDPPKWTDWWIYQDARFGLMDGADELLLKFLCRMLHPRVRSGQEEVDDLLNFFNAQLVQDGWELFSDSTLHGRPVFASRRKLVPANASSEGVRLMAETLNAALLSKQISRMESAIGTDPDLAIGTAKELIETCCKTILAERGKLMSGTPDISALTKETLRELKLVPEGVPESARGSDVIKRILNNLGAIGNGLAELRGLYGTGHGRHGKSSGLYSRHAKLAVGAAATLATFLFESHKATKLPSNESRLSVRAGKEIRHV